MKKGISLKKRRGFSLNRRQKIALALGIAVGIGVWLFPLWSWIETHGDVGLYVSGFRFRFGERPAIGATIENESHFLHLCMVALLTVFGIWLFPDSRRINLKITFDNAASYTHYEVKDTGRLIEMLRYGNHHTRAMTQEALRPLLLCLSASDSPDFSPLHLDILHTEIRQGGSRKESAFLPAVLAALEKIGDETTITFLHNYLSTARPPKRSEAMTGWAAVRKAATNCLEVLESRKQAEARRLLRASEAPPLPDTLLRPAVSAAREDPVSLLRPIEANNLQETEENTVLRTAHTTEG